MIACDNGTRQSSIFSHMCRLLFSSDEQNQFFKVKPKSNNFSVCYPIPIPNLKKLLRQFQNQWLELVAKPNQLFLLHKQFQNQLQTLPRQFQNQNQISKNHINSSKTNFKTQIQKVCSSLLFSTSTVLQCAKLQNRNQSC